MHIPSTGQVKAIDAMRQGKIVAIGRGMLTNKTALIVVNKIKGASASGHSQMSAWMRDFRLCITAGSCLYECDEPMKKTNKLLLVRAIRNIAAGEEIKTMDP